MMQKNIILTGVGGQGTVLASKLIAAAAPGESAKIYWWLYQSGARCATR